MRENADLGLDPALLTRRHILARAGAGFGVVGLSGLLHSEGLLGPTVRADSGLGQRGLAPLAPQQTHFPGRARQVIWIFVNGGPSQVDTWDFKPGLVRRNGMSIKTFDPKFENTTGFFRNSVGNLMASPFAFQRRGECGKPISSIFPHLGGHADKMAFVHSVFTESNNHSPALFMMNCGMPRMGLPCVGSWVTYGLGSSSQDLPAFVVMSDPKGRGLPKGHAANWSAGF